MYSRRPLPNFVKVVFKMNLTVGRHVFVLYHESIEDSGPA